MVAALLLFGKLARSADVEAFFKALDTYRRPEISRSNDHVYYDWVLVPRRGLELGFVDSEYQRGGPRASWGRGELQLAQAYFYTGFDDVQRYTGALPFQLEWTDSRQRAQDKLSSYESTRHSYRSDTWDVPGYRLTVTYKEQYASIDRIACRVLPSPLRGVAGGGVPRVSAIFDAFGETIRARPFAELWNPRLSNADVETAEEDSELDLTDRFGATLGFAPSEQGPVFRSITLHRARDMDSIGWPGALPHGLSFEDDPVTLFQKIAHQTTQLPVQHVDSALTGHAVWHFDDHTLHVLYSHVDNRLLRVKLIAPGTWKCIED